MQAESFEIPTSGGAFISTKTEQMVNIESLKQVEAVEQKKNSAPLRKSSTLNKRSLPSSNKRRRARNLSLRRRLSSLPRLRSEEWRPKRGYLILRLR